MREVDDCIFITNFSLNFQIHFFYFSYLVFHSFFVLGIVSIA